jgi:methylmalonyl-CoA/ethylmalonyl-CoA epimerase
MKPTHIEHLGIAVNSLEESIPFFENVLGLTCYAVEEVAEQKVKTAFFLVGQTKIELLESTDPEGLLASFWNPKAREYTCGFRRGRLARPPRQLGRQGIRLIDKSPRKGAERFEYCLPAPQIYLRRSDGNSANTPTHN